MWIWLEIFIFIMIFWILIEEGIYFFVNRILFGRSLFEVKWSSRFKQLKKLVHKDAS